MARLLTFLTSARPAAVDIAQLYASNQKESITLDQIWIKGEDDHIARDGRRHLLQSNVGSLSQTQFILVVIFSILGFLILTAAVLLIAYFFLNCCGRRSSSPVAPALYVPAYPVKSVSLAAAAVPQLEEPYDPHQYNPAALQLYDPSHHQMTEEVTRMQRELEEQHEVLSQANRMQQQQDQWMQQQQQQQQQRDLWQQQQQQQFRREQEELQFQEQQQMQMQMQMQQQMQMQMQTPQRENFASLRSGVPAEHSPGVPSIEADDLVRRLLERNNPEAALAVAKAAGFMPNSSPDRWVGGKRALGQGGEGMQLTPIQGPGPLQLGYE